MSELKNPFDGEIYFNKRSESIYCNERQVLMPNWSFETWKREVEFTINAINSHDSMVEQLAKQQEEIERLNIDMQSLINLGHKANSRLRDDAIRQQEELDEPVYGISMFSCGCLEEVGSQLTKKQAEEWCKELNQSNDDYLDKSFFVTYDYHLAKHNKGE